MQVLGRDIVPFHSLFLQVMHTLYQGFAHFIGKPDGYKQSHVFIPPSFSSSLYKHISDISPRTLSAGTPFPLPLPAGFPFYILERTWSHEGEYPVLHRRSIWLPLPFLSPNHSLPERSGWSVPHDRPLHFFV